LLYWEFRDLTHRRTKSVLSALHRLFTPKRGAYLLLAIMADEHALILTWEQLSVTLPVRLFVVALTESTFVGLNALSFLKIRSTRMHRMLTWSYAIF
jgi:hypothetical protein